ncbi:MAG: class I SAM-dependent methyltransferase [Chloroflexota bacterium]
MSTYDNHYQESNLFGDPYPEFVQFIEAWPERGSALDFGCGQGRDALFLAEAGYEVTGLDLSSVGIEQMMAEAEQRGLTIRGIASDFYTWEFDQTYDLILFNSIFHFEKNDRENEISLLKTACKHLNPDGLLSLFIHKSVKKEKIVKDVIGQYPSETWQVVVDEYINYTYTEKKSNFKTDMQYNMYIVQRQA